MNKVFLSGMIADTPAPRMEVGETPHLTFSLRVRHRTRAGEVRSEFYRVNAWRNAARWGAEKLARGQIVGVQGYLTQRRVAGEGEPMFVTEVTAEEFLFARNAHDGSDEIEAVQAG